MNPDWKALADAVRTRREFLGLRQSDLENRGGPSHSSVKNIEQANREKYSTRTLTGLERALGWPEDTVRKILDGTVTDADLRMTTLMVEMPTVVTGTVHANLGGLSAKAGGEVTPRPPLVVEVATILQRIIAEANSPTAPEAVDVLSRLLPELYGTSTRAAMDAADAELKRRADAGENT